ncbi:zinc ribbon domain-containing protein [Thermostichus vulcanus]|uniref:zinc ribbon domain-containing protein n=1 Tax=Thermostichus vulcanus TaxID=32053 RepID=UPI003CC58897
MLEAVAVKRGKRVLAENPNGTSQACSGCGEQVQKTLTDRVQSAPHRWRDHCPHCGLEMDRDWNAARNLLHRAQRTLGQAFAGCGGSLGTSPVKQQLSFVNLRGPRYSAA